MYFSQSWASLLCRCLRDFCVILKKKSRVTVIRYFQNIKTQRYRYRYRDLNFSSGPRLAVTVTWPLPLLDRYRYLAVTRT